ncbi:MAG TPA: protein kinase [Kofleriaceae bacterium]|jgi:serine/threonine-protein kinase
MSGIPAGAGSLLGKRLGKYEILALLALGGTAEIYLARIGGAAGFEKYVVVKCLHDHLADDQEFVKMFLDEARLAAHLDHSNIVQTMELGEHENRYYMVMEFLAGLSLAMVVRRAGDRLSGGRLPPPLSLNIVAQSCAGLHYAHERAINGKALNIVHRDISPQNLVVSFEGVVKVVDFGIAKAELRETKTRSGTIKGKFAYMSPEQCVANNVDRRTDVFALGVILWELLTGKRLFKRNSPYETYQAVIDCNVDIPSKHNHELDPAIDAIVMKALAKAKEHRYPTAEAFGDALLGYLHHRGKGSGPSEVGRFFDVQFTQEIEEHGARMRELIAQASSEDFSVDTGVGWTEEDGGKNTVSLSAKKDEESMSLDVGDMLSIDRASQAGLTGIIDDLDGNDPVDDDDMPAERTRIEANPLERIEEYERQSQRQVMAPIASAGPVSPRAASIPSLVKPGGGAVQANASNTLAATPGSIVPVVPQGANGNATVALQPNKPLVPGRIATPPAGQKPVMPPSGPLPLPAPPQVAQPAPAGRNVQGTAGPRSATHVAQPLPNLAEPPQRQTPNRPSFGPEGASNLPTMIAAPDPRVSELAGAATQLHQAQEEPIEMRPSAPMGYPVMNAQMSEAMARGGDVFPSSPPGQMQHHPSGPQGSHQNMGMMDSGGYPAAPNPNLMSPVGPQYPNQVDWAQQAAMPAKALQTWQLIALFVGVILGATLLTLIIAKIAHHHH